jgi:hypothetical protein
LLGTLCAFFAGSNATAGAQSTNHIDPGGPAGHEYAIPSEDALDQTGAAPPGAGPGAPSGKSAGGEGSAAAPGSDPRLFGVGVGPAGDGSTGASQGSTQAPGQAAGSPRDTARQPAAEPARWAELSDGGGGAPLWLLSAVALGLIAGAGALAFALRRPRLARPAG